MAWVKSEYAGEVAVLSTWLFGLLPWAGTYLGEDGFSLVAVRFLFFRIQYVFGLDLPGEQPFLWTWEVPGFQVSPELVLGGRLALAAMVVYLVPLAFSVAYYLDEERIEDLPVDPVRFLGGSLAVVAALLTASGALFVRYHGGVTIPVGVVLAAAIAYVLLTVERQ